MKKLGILAAGAALCATAALAGTASTPVAAHKHFYVDGALGYGSAGYTKTYADAAKAEGATSVHRNSVAWLADMGYAVNDYFAVEAGYMRLPHLSYKTNMPNVAYPERSDTQYLGKTLFERRQAGFTLAAKGIYPINAQFDIFAKGGVLFNQKSVYIENQYDAGQNPGDSDNSVKARVDIAHSIKVMPFFALGADYNITPDWAANIQMVATVKQGATLTAPNSDGSENHTYRPGTFTVLAGATYHFA